MGRLIGILIAAVPFALAWGGPILEVTGLTALAHRIAGLPFLRLVAWGALVLGGFLALLNLFLSVGRPLILQARGIRPEKQCHVSGFPLLGSFLLMFATIPFFPHVWPCVLVTALLVLDTGGPLWFLICTWKDDSLWTSKRSPNNAPEDTARKLAEPEPDVVRDMIMKSTSGAYCPTFARAFLWCARRPWRRWALHLPWFALVAYPAIAFLYATYMGILCWQQAHPEPGSFGPLWCGNTVTAPLMPLLSWGTPLALASLAWLVFTRRAAARPALRITLASLLFAVPTVGLLSFAIWFFHGPPLGGSFKIADQVWWLFGI